MQARPSAAALASLQTSENAIKEHVQANGHSSSSSTSDLHSSLPLVGVAIDESPWDVIVAVRQGNIIATAFHPEFTNDLRWHSYFVDIIESSSHES